jgi:predicted transcriptional regulator
MPPNNSISLGRATSNTITGHTTPAEAVADIQSGKWAKQIAALRAATGDERDRLKKTLPAFLWAGKFTTRKNEGIVIFSGYLCADIDDVAERIAELHDIARNDPHVVACFVSPSGTGIKIVFAVAIAADAKQHHQNFVAVRAHVTKIYNAQVDEAAKDVARLCFVSSDPAAFFNADAVPLDVTSEPATVASVQPLAVAEKGGRNNAAFNLACECRDKGQTPAEAQAAVRDFAAKCNPPLPEAEADGCVKSAFSQPPRLPGVVELPEIIDAAAFVAELIDPPAELVEGFLHKGSKLVFGGSSKSFKTWSLLDLAISVAYGADWLGRRTAQGKVLFLNFEIQPHAWQFRIIAVAKAKGVEIKPGAIQLWNLRGHAADFRQLIPQIIQRCRAENFALIVLDPIYKLYGNTDENSAGNVALLLNALERLATESGAAIAFGAHFAKGNASAKEAIDRISGSGVFARDPDSLLIFTKHETADAFTVEPILRNFAPVEPFAVRWQFPLMQLADDLDPAKLKQVAGRKREYNPKKLLSAIAKTTRENPISVSAWATAGNVPRQTLTDYLPEMRRQKWIETTGEGNTARQYITNEGKAFINEN